MTIDDYISIRNFRDTHLVEYHFNDDVSSYIACQFALESNYFKSNLVLAYNNASGMRFPLHRPNLCCSKTSSGFACYRSLFACVRDFFIRQFLFAKTWKDFSSIELYRAFLVRSNYCPEIDYVGRIDRIYNQFINFQNSKKS